MNSALKLAIMEIVKQIPNGKVMYFGQIADIVGTTARIVGFIMTGLSEVEMENIPWYRVVAKDGYISSIKLGDKGIIQKNLLEKEGYFIQDNNKVNMNIHLWILAGIQRDENLVDQYSSFVKGLKR